MEAALFAHLASNQLQGLLDSCLQLKEVLLEGVEQLVSVHTGLQPVGAAGEGQDSCERVAVEPPYDWLPNTMLDLSVSSHPSTRALLHHIAMLARTQALTCASLQHVAEGLFC